VFLGSTGRHNFIPVNQKNSRDVDVPWEDEEGGGARGGEEGRGEGRGKSVRRRRGERRERQGGGGEGIRSVRREHGAPQLYSRKSKEFL
jgi:hypothetical protein